MPITEYNDHIIYYIVYNIVLQIYLKNNLIMILLIYFKDYLENQTKMYIKNVLNIVIVKCTKLF